MEEGGSSREKVLFGKVRKENELSSSNKSVKKV